MNKKEAIRATTDGNKIKHIDWDKTNWATYVEFNNMGFVDERGTIFIFNDHPENDWEIYRETKKMKFWQFIDDTGNIIPGFCSEHGSRYWDGTKDVHCLVDACFENWTRTNCYIEKEVEI